MRGLAVDKEKTNKVVYSALKYAVRKHHESAVNIYTSLNNNLT